MEYKISERAKKVTLGTAVLGLIFLIIGFFQQKEFVYANKIDNHSVEIKYNGHADQDAQNALKESITSKLADYEIEIHDANHGHNEHATNDESHGHHGPTFLWNIHFKHAENHSSLIGTHESGADILIDKVNNGEISFFDNGFRRFWSNLLVNGFFFFGIALGALFYLALHYATESTSGSNTYEDDNYGAFVSVNASAVFDYNFGVRIGNDDQNALRFGMTQGQFFLNIVNPYYHLKILYQKRPTKAYYLKMTHVKCVIFYFFSSESLRLR